MRASVSWGHSRNDAISTNHMQVEEVCDRGRVVPQVLHCKLHRMALTVWQFNRCSTECGATPQNDQNATGREWYGLTEATDFQEVRYQVVKLQGLCLVQNSFLLLWLLGCGEYVDSHCMWLVRAVPSNPSNASTWLQIGNKSAFECG